MLGRKMLCELKTWFRNGGGLDFLCMILLSGFLFVAAFSYFVCVIHKTLLCKLFFDCCIYTLQVGVDSLAEFSQWAQEYQNETNSEVCTYLELLMRCTVQEGVCMRSYLFVSFMVRFRVLVHLECRRDHHARSGEVSQPEFCDFCS